MQYTLKKDDILTQDKIIKIIQSFQTTELPKLKRWLNYYKGKHKIVYKQSTDVGKPENKIVTNYCRTIVDNFGGYLTGKPVTYSSDEDIESILNILNYNDVWAEDSELLKNALIYGVGYEINYVDENGQQRFTSLSPLECIPIYDNTLNKDLLYVIRFWRENEYDQLEARYYIEVYSKTHVHRFTSNEGFTSFTPISEEPHYFKQCPVTVMELEESIFNQIISLQDAYNTLLSSEVDDFEGFADAYLILKGMIADSDDLADMKSKRVLMLDTDASAEYLTKSISDTQITNMLQNIHEQIFNKSNCPDFTSEKFMAQSGVAIRYKLLQFENSCSVIEAKLKKALQRRIELISAIERLTTGIEVWRDIKIEVNRNLPTDLENSANVVNSLRGLVSTETLLTQIPFVTDPEEEMKRLEAERQANLALYDFGGDDNDMDESSNNQSN